MLRSRIRGVKQGAYRMWVSGKASEKRRYLVQNLLKLHTNVCVSVRVSLRK